MKREELQALGLNDDQINAVMKQNGMDIEAAKQAGGSAEAASEKARADRLQTQLDEITVSLAAAQESASSAAALRKSFDELSAKHNATIKANAVRDAAAAYNPKDIALLMRLLDLDKMTVEADGKVTGLKEQIDPLQESNGYLFANSPDIKGGSPDGGTPGNTFDMNAFLRG